MTITRAAAVALSILSTVVSTGALAQGQDMRECDMTFIGQLPLPDAGGLFYTRVGVTPQYSLLSGGTDWRQVGLYGSGQVTRPQAHEAAGLAIAQQIQPIGGKIVMLSIGMSNTFQEFGRFEVRAEGSPVSHPALEIVNAAIGGQAADSWDTPDAATWDIVDDRLQQNGLTPDQVQIAWMKHAVRSPQVPPLDFPTHPESLQTILEGIMTSLKTNYPNVKLAYISSRTRAYNSNQNAQSPEPHAYEGGLAVQWMIDKQIQGDPSLEYDGAGAVAPWLSWGPYLWTDGMGAAENDPPEPHAARSDGFVWSCADVQNDGVHPSPPTPGPGDPNGEFKVGDQLMSFFKTDVTATPWFLASTTGGPQIVSLTANGQEVGGGTIFGTAPFTVNLSVAASGNVDEVTWNHDDGTFSYNPVGTNTGQPYFDDMTSPTKIFRTPGTYDVRVAINDPAGNLTHGGLTVVVQPPAACAGAIELLAERPPAGEDATIRWCAEPTAERYNVYRGSEPDLGDLSCWRPGLVTAATIDGEPLASGQVRLYLVTFVAGGVESSLGQSSDGQPRAAAAPCPD